MKSDSFKVDIKTVHQDSYTSGNARIHPSYNKLYINDEFIETIGYRSTYDDSERDGYYYESDYSDTVILSDGIRLIIFISSAPSCSDYNRIIILSPEIIYDENVRYFDELIIDDINKHIDTSKLTVYWESSYNTKNFVSSILELL